jgi:predicted transposase/invertase (TIGR01784 family)
MLFNDCTVEDVIALNREESWEEGHEKGLNEGERKARRETAKALKSMGLSVGQIAMSTKLPAEEITAL